jgi:hypothetical protein
MEGEPGELPKNFGLGSSDDFRYLSLDDGNRLFLGW